MLQPAVCPGVTLVDEQVRVFSCAALKDNVAVEFAPFADAVRIADPSAVRVPTEAVKPALVAPPTIVTVPGAETLGLLLEIVTAKPALGAWAERDIVQLVEPSALTLDGEQVNVLICGIAPSMIRTAWDCPFTLAVITSVTPETLGVRFAAANVALVCPAPMVI
jgi:hypothetical protein